MASGPTTPRLELPFEPLPAISDATRAAITEAAREANEHYLREFIEAYSFCPFAREGRRAGTTECHVYWADSSDPVPLFELMRDVASRPNILVAQVVFPFVEVSAPRWRSFCHELTRAAHAHIGGPPTMAVAALHPELAYSPANPFSLLTLFRRAPDPTVQWVRLDGLDAIYAGRRKRTVVLTPAQIAQLVLAPPARQLDLYDRIAETNMAMALRIGLPQVEATLAGYAADARRAYRRILLEAT